MDWSTLVAVGIAVVTPSLAYYFGIRSKQLESRFQFKQEKYRNLLAFLYDAYIDDAASSLNKKQFYREFYKVWIYGSRDVIDSMNDFRRLFEGGKNVVSEFDANQIIERIVLAMRRDLGVRSRLTPGSLYYSFIEDSRESDDGTDSKRFELGEPN